MTNKVEETYKPIDARMDEIFVDYRFNSRGMVYPYQVTDLVDNLKRNELQTPVSVQPYSDPNNPKLKWKLIAGFRRHKSFEVLERESIPAFVKEGLTEEESREYNIVENVNREDLNPVQEAKALSYYFERGYTEDMVAAKFSKSLHWAKSRKVILGLPEEIQKLIASGFIKSHQQIIAFQRMTKDKQFELIRSIKDRTFRTEMLGVNMREHKKRVKLNKELFELKQPDSKAIERLKIAMYMGSGPDLHTRILAWCEGVINEKTMWRDVQEWANKNGYTIEMPDEIKLALGIEVDPIAA